MLPGKDNLTFYLSGERRWQGDRGPTFMPNTFKSDLETRGLSGDRLPSNTASGYTFQGKLNWQPSDQLTFKAGGLGSQEDWRQFPTPISSTCRTRRATWTGASRTS